MELRAAAPPGDEPPERLFRALAARRPERPLPRLVAGHRLTARAVPAREEWAAEDAAASEEVEELRPSLLQRQILWRVLRLGDGPAFASPDEVGALDGAALASLVADVGAALWRIAPTYARSDVEAWARVLERGAAHPSNVADAVALASCVDMTPGGGVVPRLDRYWGCPVVELLDGHWMVWRAARTAVERIRK